MVPGVWKPVYLAHGGKAHGLLHSEVIVPIEAGVAGVGSRYFGNPIQVRVYTRIGLRSVEMTVHRAKFAFQVQGVVVQFVAVVSNEPFLFLQFLMHINIGNEPVVINGVEGDVDLSVEGIVAGEGG